MARLVREYRNILSIAIAQTQMEQASSPSMTAFTTQWACRNSAINDTSVDASGNGLSHVGRIHKQYPLNAIVPNPPGANGCRFYSRAPGAAVGASAKAFLCRMGGPSKAEACIPCQHVKTRAVSASLRP